MKAIYRENPAYPCNPFIEALPAQMDMPALMRRIERIDAIGEEIRNLPTEQRVMYVSKVMEAFVPLGYTPLIYNLIYQGMLCSYANKTTVETTRQVLRIRASLDNGGAPETRAFMTQAASSSILGAPGIGKTTTIMRIVGTIPQVIEHERYKGTMFFCKQITYLFIQTPNDGSVKGFCIQMLAEMDRLLGTQYAPKGQAGRGQTVDALIARISQLCLTHHVGVLIIDEIQNIVTMNKQNGFSARLIRFFVQLMNDTGVSVILVGTPEVGAFFDQQPHLARRTRGLRIGALAYGTAFESLVKVLWEQQVMKVYEPLDETMIRLLYEVSGGIPALVAQLICYAQQYAITSGEERLNMEVMRETVAIYQLRKPSGIAGSVAASAFSTEKHEEAVMVKMAAKGRPKTYRDEDDILLLYERYTYDALLEQFRVRGWVKEGSVC